MKARTRFADFGSAVTTTAASQVLIVAFGFLTSVAIARLLGAEGRGEYALFVNAGLLATIYFGFGISTGITYYVASGQTSLATLVRPLAATLGVLGAVVAVVTAIVAVSPLGVFLPGTVNGTWWIPTVAITAYFVFTQCGGWLTAALAGRRAFLPINVVATTVSLLALVCSTGLLSLRPSWAGPWAIVAMTVVLEGARAVLLSAALLRQPKHHSEPNTSISNSRGRPGLLRVLWRYSAISYVADALQFLTYRFDMWLVAAYWGAAELGRYALAVSIAQLVWIIPGAAATILFPWVATMDPSRSPRFTWRVAWISFGVSVGLAVSGWAISTVAIVPIFGPDFQDASHLIGLLLIGVVPYSFARVLSNYLAGVNAVGLNAIASGTILPVALLLYFALIPGYGAAGAAVSTAAAYVVHTIIIAILFLRRTGKIMTSRS